jgi:Domain of unknown function (DUF932)
MFTNTALQMSSHARAFDRGLSIDEIRARAPAIFAGSAHQRMSSKYTFIPTERVLMGLIDSGFVPMEARQARARRSSPMHARHLVRLRRRFETVQLRDAVPEVVFLNSHDGTSAYQLRIGIFRMVCTNGLIVSQGVFPAYCVSHRGNVVEDVILAALELAGHFSTIVEHVERMERRRLDASEQVEFAERALTLRYPGLLEAGMAASQLLTCRRDVDMGDDLWSILNRVQENMLKGGLARRSPRGRLVSTRGITAIREEVRLNAGLWDLAMDELAA